MLLKHIYVKPEANRYGQGKESHFPCVPGATLSKVVIKCYLGARIEQTNEAILYKINTDFSRG